MRPGRIPFLAAGVDHLAVDIEELVGDLEHGDEHAAFRATGGVPAAGRTPDEFAKQWQESEEHRQLLKDIEEYQAEFPVGDGQVTKFQQSRKAQQAKHMSVSFLILSIPFIYCDCDRSVKSPYTISFPMQVRLCTKRGLQRLRGDMANFYATVFGNFFMALIIGLPFS